MMLSFAAFAFSTLQPASGGQIGAHVAIDYAAIFLQKGGAIDATLVTSASSKTLEGSIPFRSGQYGMVELTCTGLNTRGSVTGCKHTNTQPANTGYDEAADRILPYIHISGRLKNLPAPKVRFVSIQLRFSNSDTADMTGPCWEPRCITEPLPPIPPPLYP